MGSFAAPMEHLYVQKLGDKLWKHHTKAINEMWVGLKKRLFSMHLDYRKIYIYQDGLPVCGKELEIINDLAEKGSVNHRILRELIRRGALLMGTEDPQLLLEEYHYLQEIFRATGSDARQTIVKEYTKRTPLLLKKRDVFISKRIGETLLHGMTAILFMGLTHRIDELLPADIQVTYLIYRLPFERSFEMELAK